jgi:tetratricopeptide (TPR) repeat protein
VRWQAALLALAAGCADWGRPPLTAPYRAGEPVVQEQALVGISADGSAAAVQLVDAEGAPPRLELIVLDGAGGPTRHLAGAPDEASRAVARRLRAEGNKAMPLLAAAVRQAWPEAVAFASRQGFAPLTPALPERPRQWAIVAKAAGSPPLLLHLALSEEDPPAFVLLLGFPSGTDASASEVELARQPIAGTPIAGGLWQAADVVWLLSGSVADTDPLRRAVGLRRGSLRRGEAELHDRRGLALRAARDLAGASREFDRALAADPRFVEALYNAASAAAVSGREEEAVALLRRAAEVDRRRVEVLGRADESLAALRRRSDVREILGMKRQPP